MDKIIEISEADGDARVQTGVKWEDLNRHLEEKGVPLFFPLDPGPGATIGGMAGTGCSGTNAVRYGTAKAEWFLNLVRGVAGEQYQARERAARDRRRTTDCRRSCFPRERSSRRGSARANRQPGGTRPSCSSVRRARWGSSRKRRSVSRRSYRPSAPWSLSRASRRPCRPRRRCKSRRSAWVQLIAA